MKRRTLLLSTWRHVGTPCAALVAATLIMGCDGASKDKPATQTAAKVNKEEITLHQINAVLAQQRGVPADQADQAARRILERLIDQELAVQKAAELKLDRDARVVQLIETARRDIIARAYAERLGEGAPKPTPAEIKKYYDSNPALFRDRRVYQLQEVTIQAQPGQAEALRAKLRGYKSAVEMVDYLKASGFKFTANQVVRAAEQLPLSLLPTLSGMKDGQSVFNATPAGASVMVLVSSRPQPVDEERAARAIEQFLHNDQKRKLLSDDLKALRAAAKIEYLGKYSAAAPAAEPTKLTSPAEVAASAAAAMEDKVQASSSQATEAAVVSSIAVEASGSAPKAASAADRSTIDKGLGLK
jgi:EpsD family peptidyl-prolyl cis-trans isomerase